MFLAPAACAAFDHQPDSESNQGDLSVTAPPRPWLLGNFDNDLYEIASGRIKIFVFTYDYHEIVALISRHGSIKSDSRSGSNLFGRALSPAVSERLAHGRSRGSTSNKPARADPSSFARRPRLSGKPRVRPTIKDKYFHPSDSLPERCKGTRRKRRSVRTGRLGQILSAIFGTLVSFSCEPCADAARSRHTVEGCTPKIRAASASIRRFTPR